jgi:hypothetical protein
LRSRELETGGTGGGSLNTGRKVHHNLRQLLHVWCTTCTLYSLLCTTLQ